MPSLWLWLARVLTLIALAIAVYLLIVSGWAATPLLGCGNESSCDAVLGSAWSRWLGMPVTVPGAAVYLLTCLGLLLIAPRWPIQIRRGAWKALLVLAVVQAGSAVWFLALQAFVLRSVCPFCLAAHACGLLGAALIFFHSPVAWKPRIAPSGEGLSVRSAAVLVLFGLVGPAILMAAQLRSGERNDAILVEQKNVPRMNDVSDAGSRPGTSAAPLPRKVLELFDYTCLHCRRLHGEMKKVKQRYGPQLSVVVFPMAMCRDCNPFVKKTEPGHELACEYARLALAVKILDGAAFEKFHEWLMAPAEVPPLGAAQAYAGQLVGSAALQRVLTGSQPDLELRKITDYYGATGQGTLPKLIAGQTILTGAASEQQLIDFLEKNAGVRASN
jgi:uncharacterized membrane protein